MQFCKRVSLSLMVLLGVVGVALGQKTSKAPQPTPPEGCVSVLSFLPEGYVTDGSVSYQAQLQQAIDAAGQKKKVLVFPPMTYLIEDESGLKLRSGLTLFMYGAVFLMDADNSKDGQVFLGQDVTDVRMLGGEIAGQRDSWKDSVNIAGIRILGKSARIHIADMFMHDLSSTGVGIFAKSYDAMTTDVVIENTIIRRCCNKYTDYLQPNQGPAKGSLRTDQGSIAFYHVKNFLIHGCSLEDSRSDGTHFYRCQHGRFTDNKVTGSKMGGYFVEDCLDILASANLIRGNGSRGVTIERNSRDCTLVHNIIEGSGREGLWAPNVVSVVVTDNIFRKNGRKDHGDLDCEIIINTHKSVKTLAEDIRVADNIIYASEHQNYAIRVSLARGVVIENNSMRGPVRTIRADSWLNGDGEVIIRNNDGWKTENAGVARIDGDGVQTVFRIPHGLDFSDPNDPRMLKYVSVLPTVIAGSRDAAGPVFVSTDVKAIIVEFLTPPSAGKANVTLHWSVRVVCCGSERKQ